MATQQQWDTHSAAVVPLLLLCCVHPSVTAMVLLSTRVERGSGPLPVMPLVRLFELQVGAFPRDGAEVLTPLGHHLAQLPVDPR